MQITGKLFKLTKSSTGINFQEVITIENTEDKDSIVITTPGIYSPMRVEKEKLYVLDVLSAVFC